MNRKLIADLGGFIQQRYGVQLKEDIKLLAHFTKVVEQIDEQILNNYFSDKSEDGWQSGSSFDTRATGRKMVDYINSLENVKTILDIGCGNNILKPYFPDKKFLGVDPYNDNADLKLGVDELKTDLKFDVVLILGSLNFGDEADINRQFVKAFGLCKPGGKIFLRANPGITHANDNAKWIDFYEWSHEKVQEFADKLGATVNELGWDHDDADETKWGNRIYAELTRDVFRKNND